MDEFPFGTTVRCDLIYRDDEGGLADPTDEAAVITQDPDGTETTYEYATDDEVTRIATGRFKFKFIPDAAGRWTLRGKGLSGDDEVAREIEFEVTPSVFAEP